MPKLDSLKEELNTIRVAVSIIFILVMGITSWIVKQYYLNIIDALFWLALVFDILLLLLIPVLWKKSKEKIKEIERL